MLLDMIKTNTWKRAVTTFLAVVLIMCLVAGNNLAPTMASFLDIEAASANVLQAWSSSLWTQTSQVDFNAGVLNNVDTAANPGNVILDTALSEPVTSTGAEQAWYYAAWSRRAPVTITNTGSGQTDYQVRVDVTYDGDMQADFDDIRFVDSDDATPLNYWRETYTASTSAVFWVKIPSVPAGSKIIYMYYGNGSASYAGNGNATFDFFDDFSGDLSQWTIDTENTDAVYIDAGQGNVAPALRHDPDSSQTKNGYFDTRLMTSSYTMLNGVIEYDVFLAGAPRIIHQLGFRVDSLSFNNGYCWRMQNATADGGWLRFNSGSWSKIGANWGPTTGGVWHSVKMEVVGTDFTAYVDGGGAISVMDTTKQTADYLVSHVHGVSLTAGSYVLMDNIRVRKYASVEPTSSVDAEDGWSRLATVTVSNPLAGLTGYQVRVDVTYDGDMQPDFDDIRFFDSDGITPLGHWRESYIPSSSAIFWVRVPSVPSGNKIIYMHYGNSAAGSASNGDATFEFYDDFEDGDISDWSQYGSGTVQIANDVGNLVLLKTANNDPSGGYSMFNYGALTDFEVTLRTKRINESGGSQNRYGIENGSFNGYGPRMYDFSTLPASFAIERRTGGASSNLVIKSTSVYQWNTWMTVVFRKIGTSLEFELYNSSGALVESISTTDATYNAFNRFVVHGGWEFYTDDIRVRKYAAQYGYVASGTLVSPVLDTGTSGTTWDGLFWDETLLSNTDIVFEVRASDTAFNAGDTAPFWSSVGGASPVVTGLPSGRYMQWRAVLATADTTNTPTLHEVRVYYY